MFVCRRQTSGYRQCGYGRYSQSGYVTKDRMGKYMDTSARFMAGFVAIQMLLLMALAVVSESTSSADPAPPLEITKRLQKPAQIQVVTTPRTISL